MKRSFAVLLWASLSMFAGNALADAPLYGFKGPHREGEYIVVFKDKAAGNRAFLRAAGIEEVRAFESSPAYLVKLSSDRSAANLKALRSNPAVSSIQANRVFKMNLAANDPSLSKQYQHKIINDAAAWDVTTGSKDVIVAIIDTGVNYKHPDIAPNYWTNPGETGLDANGNDKATNGIDDDGNGYVDDWHGWDFVNNDNDPMDDHGHGTHCAGIIGAKGNNGVGGSGINWDVSLVGLKFINGKTGEGDTAGAVQAIEYATKMGFDITSNSWGGTVDDSDSADDAGDEDVLLTAIKANTDAGHLFVAAAGNELSNNDKKPVLPASYDIDGILSVAASTSSDRLAFYSNYGATTVDLAAPGSDIYSTVLGSGYESMSGTSMAAPVVAGAAALLKAAHPDWTGLELKEQLMKTVDPISNMKNKVLTGGRLNVGRALTE